MKQLLIRQLDEVISRIDDVLKDSLNYDSDARYNMLNGLLDVCMLLLHKAEKIDRSIIKEVNMMMKRINELYKDFTFKNTMDGVKFFYLKRIIESDLLPLLIKTKQRLECSLESERDT